MIAKDEAARTAGREGIAAPYPGLRPFQPHEAAIFFGRDEHVADMLTVLEDHRFLAVVGPSGAGKSSLVLAGLLPALQNGMLLTARSPDWRMIVMRPGDAPFRNLAGAIQRSMAPKEAATNGTKRFHDGDPALTEIVLRVNPFGFMQAVLDAGVPDSTNLLLLVDQFEELFRFRNVDGAVLSAAEASERRNDATAFVKLLLETARQARRPVHVMLTMRSDFLGECDMFEGLPQAINESQFLTPRLTFRQLERAIVQPLTLPEFAGRVQPELVQRIQNDMGSDRDQLPVVQHALFRTWQRALKRAHGSQLELQLADYEEIGGIHEALSRHCDEALDELAHQGLDRAVERVFRGLCTLGPTGQRIRRPVKIGRLAQEAGMRPEQIERVVRVFSRFDRCFVVASPADPLTEESTVDISHESLIRQWRKLSDPARTGAGWIEKEEAAARRWRRLVESAGLDQERTSVRGSSRPSAKLRDPELQRVLDWWKDEQPTAAWADRYEPGTFELVKDFVEASRVEHEMECQRSAELRKEREENKLREQELKHVQQRSSLQRKMLIGIGAVAVIAFVMFGVAVRQRTIAQSARDEAKKAADDAKKAADAESIAKERAISEGKEATRQAGIAQAERTAVLANSTPPGPRKILLAVEANRLAIEAGERVFSAEQALLDAVPPRELARNDSPILKVFANKESQTTVFVDLNQNVQYVILPDQWPVQKTRGKSPFGVQLPVAQSPDGNFLVMNRENQAVQVSYLIDGGKPQSIPLVTPAGGPSKSTMKYLEIGTRLVASGFSNGVVQLHDLTAGKSEIAAELKHPLSSIAISPDDKWLIATTNTEVVVWRTNALAKPAAKWTIRDRISGVGFTSNSEWCVIAYETGRVLADRINKADFGSDFVALSNNEVETTTMAIAPDQPLVAAGKRNGSVVVWNLAHEAPQKPWTTLFGHDKEVVEITFSADNKNVLSVGADRTVRVTELNESLKFPSRVIRDLGLASESGSGMINTATFFGDRVITGGSRLLVWELDRGQLEAEAGRASKRNLTNAEWAQFFPTRGPYRPTFAGLPTPRGIISPADKTIRYFVEQLPTVPDADADRLVTAAWDAWKRVANVQVRRVESLNDASVILKTVSADVLSGFGDASIGPPVDLQLEVRFSSEEDWDPEKFQATACHSFGHILGLMHSNLTAQIMSPIPTSGIKTPQLQDIERVQQIWGANTQTVKTSYQGLEGLAQELIDYWETDLADKWQPQEVAREDVSTALRFLVSANLLQTETMSDDNLLGRRALAEQATSRFQQLANIPVDGIIGKPTLARLGDFHVCQSTRDRNGELVPLPAESMAVQVNSKLQGTALFVFVQRLPPSVDEKNWKDMVLEAAESWAKPTGISVRIVDEVRQANVVIRTSRATQPTKTFGRADIGGRDLLRANQLSIELDEGSLDRQALVQAALVHHFGHILGLEHASEPDHAMSAVMDSRKPLMQLTNQDQQRAFDDWNYKSRARN